MSIHIRFAIADDLPLISSFIRELADYEKLTHAVHFDPDDLHRNLFGPRPYAEVLMGEVDGEAQGFALFFHNFSTFEGKAGLHLEDLYVCPAARGQGLGAALLHRLAALAVTRDCARLEWNVLDWNAPAIAFYKNMGAQAMQDWVGMRVDGTALQELAEPQ